MAKKKSLILWGLLIGTAILAIQQLLTKYELSELQLLIEAYQAPLLIAYAGLLSVRGVLFVPTIPFIILMASAISAPLMFSVTLAASTMSAWLVCVAVDKFGFTEKLDRLPAKTVKRGTGFVEEWGFYAVVGWAFFPFVFTEFIVYLARIGRMSRTSIVLAVAIGEGALIYLLMAMTEYFKGLLL